LSEISKLLQQEAAHFAKRDRARAKKSAFGSIPIFTQGIAQGLNFNKVLKAHFGDDRPRTGLALGCGEMKGEYNFFKRNKVVEVDAYDVDAESRSRFFKNTYDGEIPTINYHIADVNQLQVEPGKFDLIYIQHAYHHFEALEHVTDQLRQGLSDRGLIIMADYIGANYLQRTPKQRKFCSELWSKLPERLRIDGQGRVRDKIHIPDKKGLSPYEAIRSEEMLGILQSRLKTLHFFGYGGVAWPIVNGFAHNYNVDDPEDLDILQMIWDLDQSTKNDGTVEPNFFRGVFTR
jgi:SAM-dependent methyltransferase